MSKETQEPLHLRSVVKRDKDGNITSIAVKSTERPRFHTPAYDEIVRTGVPPWLRKRAD